MLSAYQSESPVVVGLPRGGLPVAYEVAKALNAPLDVLVVRKIGAPGNPEYGIGAIAEEDIQLVHRSDMIELNITPPVLDQLLKREVAELERRLTAIRAVHPPVDVTGRTVIVIDDGLATGITAIAAARALRKRGAGKVVLAAPVCAAPTTAILAREVDDVQCALTPAQLGSVGTWYDDFSQTTDAEVLALLEASRQRDV